MKYIDEYRNADAVAAVSKMIADISRKDIAIMEICGGQTHTILKYGLEELLPPNIRLIHGPGCPVCVTSISLIDKAIQLALMDDVILTSFGDMLRVPGTSSDLLKAKANGGDVRIVYSPLDVLHIAELNRNKNVVFFAVGFETTAPSAAKLISEAKNRKLENLFVLGSHVLVPPALEAILSSDDAQVQAIIAAGHVCTVMGYHEYESIAEKYSVPIVVTGFEPLDILQGIYLAVSQFENGKHQVENQYMRSVRREGNIPAQKLMQEVFNVVDYDWRGIGLIPQSGLKIRNEYSNFDAEHRFEFVSAAKKETSVCEAGKVLRGILKPTNCPAFGTQCNPENPLGAPMVSSEGACAAYYRYRIT